MKHSKRFVDNHGRLIDFHVDLKQYINYEILKELQ